MSHDLVGVGHQSIQGDAPGDRGEVRVPDLEGHRPAPDPVPPQAVGDHPGQPCQDLDHGGPVVDVGGQGRLLAHRFPDPVGDHRPVVLPVSDGVKVIPGLPEPRHQPLPVGPLEVGPGPDSQRPHLLLGHPAHSEELPDRQLVDKGRGPVRRNHVDPVGLPKIRGHLGEKLVERDPGRGGKPHRFADSGPDFLSNPGGRPGPLPPVGDVEVRLVQ